MHTIESIAKTVTENTHHFYCDVCGDYLGSTQEHSDGWYGQLGEFEIRYRVPDRCFVNFNKNFCEKCKQQFLDKLVTHLENIGFVKGGD